MSGHADTVPQVPAGADPPIVATLVAPLLALRAALGTGDPTPNPDLVSTLRKAAADAADTDGEHAHGLHALESSIQTSADAVPTMRTTRREISAIVDLAPRYLEVLGAAHATNADAARRVDAIIARFRRDSREVVDTATTESDGDRVIALASNAFRDALAEVNGAQGRMDQHRAELQGLQPVALSTPPGFTPSPGTVLVPTSTAYEPGRLNYGPGTGGPNGYVPNGFGTNGYNQVPGQVPGQPVDPAIQRAALEAQIQGQLIAAGVQLATTVIDAGVEVGVKALDKLADVGGKVVDVVAAGATEAIKDGLHPETSAPASPAGPAPSAPGPTPNGQFNFGTPDKPPAPAPAPAPPHPGPSSTTPPAAEPRPGPPGEHSGRAPEPPFKQPAPATAPPPPPGAIAPAAPPPPPPSPSSGPRHGQLGVTEPAPPQAPAGAPVIEPPS